MDKYEFVISHSCGSYLHTSIKYWMKTNWPLKSKLDSIETMTWNQTHFEYSCFVLHVPPFSLRICRPSQAMMRYKARWRGVSARKGMLRVTVHWFFQCCFACFYNVYWLFVQLFVYCCFHFLFYCCLQSSLTVVSLFV